MQLTRFADTVVVRVYPDQQTLVYRVAWINKTIVITAVF